MGMILLLLNWLPRLSQGLISDLIHKRKMIFEKATLKHPNYYTVYEWLYADFLQ